MNPSFAFLDVSDRLVHAFLPILFNESIIFFLFSSLISGVCINCLMSLSVRSNPSCVGFTRLLFIMCDTPSLNF